MQETFKVQDVKNREDKGAFENWAQRCFKAESVPLDPQKLAAGLPQSPRRLLASPLWGHEGGGAVAEIREGGNCSYIRSESGS